VVESNLNKHQCNKQTHHSQTPHFKNWVSFSNEGICSFVNTILPLSKCIGTQNKYDRCDQTNNKCQIKADASYNFHFIFHSLYLWKILLIARMIYSFNSQSKITQVQFLFGQILLFSLFVLVAERPLNSNNFFEKKTLTLQRSGFCVNLFSFNCQQSMIIVKLKSFRQELSPHDRTVD
jgi:hypothetical protein